jgi:hypothetical protein
MPGGVAGAQLTLAAPYADPPTRHDRIYIGAISAKTTIFLGIYNFDARMFRLSHLSASICMHSMAVAHVLQRHQ